MPVVVGTYIRRLEQEEFGRVAYGVMEHVFDIHREMGRFFCESIYQRVLASRLAGAQIEVPITLTHGNFEKTLFIDLVVDGAVFELKAASMLNGRHRAQLLNYLLLADLSHGKLVNLRPDSVEHEFINTTLRHSDRTRFDVRDDAWFEMNDQSDALMPLVLSFLRDWGTCLSISLYEEAITHVLGGKEHVERQIEVVCQGGAVGVQLVRMVSPGTALKLTAIPGNTEHFEIHARRFLSHTQLKAIQWINVTLDRVTFRTLRR